MIQKWNSHYEKVETIEEIKNISSGLTTCIIKIIEQYGLVT